VLRRRDRRRWGRGTLAGEARLRGSFATYRAAAIVCSVALAAALVGRPSLAIAQTGTLKDLLITVDETRDPVRAGTTLRYRVICRNLGSEPIGPFTIEATYDNKVRYRYAKPVPDAGTTNRWSVRRIGPGDTRLMVVRVRVPLDLPDGSLLQTEFTVLHGKESSIADYELTTVRGAPHRRGQ